MNFDIDELNQSNCHYFNGTIKVFSFLWVANTLNAQANIRIRLFRQGEKRPIREGRTDSCGEIVFNDLERGVYFVEAEVNERRFLKPIYKPSNRVRLDNGDLVEEVAVINRLRKRDREEIIIKDRDIIDDRLLIIILLLFLCGCWW